MDIIFFNLKLKLLNLNNYRLKTKGSKATVVIIKYALLKETN